MTLPLFTIDRNLAIEQLHAATAIYTTENTVDALLDRLAWPHGSRKLVDPSCGDGVFLDRALRRLLSREQLVDVRALVEGWEIHPCAAADARRRIEGTLIAHNYAPGTAASIANDVIVNADFLTDGPSQHSYDVIVGNPPYLRFSHVPALLRDDYLKVVPDHARADMLHSFLDRCARVLRDDGQIALVTSDRWLLNVSAARLRQTLGSHLSIAHVTRLDASTAFYRPKTRRTGTPPRIHPVEVILQSGATGIPLSSAAVYPDVPVTQPTAASVALSEIADIRLAPWMGREGLFVVNERVARTLPSDLLVPVVDTDDVGSDNVLRTPRRFAIRTTATPPRVIIEHLEANRHLVSPRAAKRFASWHPPEAFGPFPLQHDALLVPRIARELRPVRLPAGVVPINHNLNVVDPRNISLQSLIHSLRSDAVQQWIGARAQRLENGFFSITPSLLRQLPLPIAQLYAKHEIYS